MYWFLRMAGFCHVWIPNFGLTAKPLYETLNGTDVQQLVWTGKFQKAFEILKQSLMMAPLGLLDIQKEFKFYVHEMQGLALTVLLRS